LNPMPGQMDLNESYQGHKGISRDFYPHASEHKVAGKIAAAKLALEAFYSPALALAANLPGEAVGRGLGYPDLGEGAQHGQVGPMGFQAKVGAFRSQELGDRCRAPREPLARMAPSG
jgi:hypothetical protein